MITDAGTPTPLVARDEKGTLVQFWTQEQIEAAILTYGADDIDCCIQNQGEHITRLQAELEAAQAEIAALRVNDARYKVRRAAIFQMRLRTEIPGYRNWKPTTVEEFNAEYDASCDKEALEQDAARKAK